MAENEPNGLGDVSQAEEDIAALSALLKPRLEQARRSEFSTKTFEGIREGAKRRVKISRAYGAMTDGA